MSWDKIYFNNHTSARHEGLYPSGKVADAASLNFPPSSSSTAKTSMALERSSGTRRCLPTRLKNLGQVLLVLTVCSGCVQDARFGLVMVSDVHMLGGQHLSSINISDYLPFCAIVNCNFSNIYVPLNTGLNL